jgi:hypothetical protein
MTRAFGSGTLLAGSPCSTGVSCDGLLILKPGVPRAGTFAPNHVVNVYSSSRVKPSGTNQRSWTLKNPPGPDSVSLASAHDGVYWLEATIPEKSKVKPRPQELHRVVSSQRM